MKHFLSLLGLDVNKTLCLTVGSPSAHRRNSRLKHLAFMLLFLLGSLNVWGDPVSGSIVLGDANGAWNATTTASFTDENDLEWSRTYSSNNKQSIQGGMCQFGNSSNPCTSLVLSTTIGSQVTLSAFSANFTGGASKTSGTIKLYSGTTELASATVSGTASVICEIPSSVSVDASDAIKVEYTGTSGSIKISGISYTYTSGGGGGETAVLEGIAVGGDLTDKTYETTDKLDLTGLTVTGSYDDESEKEITSGITWKVRTNSTSEAVNLDAYTLTAGQTSVEVQATVSEVSSEWKTITSLTVTAPEGDIINIGDITFDGTSSYCDWNTVAKTSASYAGNSNYTTSYIQLRNQGSAGIVSTTSGGKIKKVKVKWANLVSSPARTITIYGKNTAYEGPADLYDNDKRGTELGSIAQTTVGTTNEFVYDGSKGDFAYVGVKASGALYFTPITFVWESTPKHEVTFGVKSGDESKGTLEASVGGNAISSGDEVEEGAEVTLTATATENAGRFKKWTATGLKLTDEQAIANPLVFSMPTGDATVTASFDALYAITKDAQGAQLTVGAEYAAEGDEVSVAAEAISGFGDPSSLTVFKTGDENTTVEISNGKFTMPGYAVTVKATYTQQLSSLDAPTLGVAAVTYQGATLNWTGVEGNEGYVLTLKKGNEIVEGYNAVAIDKNATSYEIASGLLANTDYTYSIYTKGDGTNTLLENTPVEGNFTTADYPSVAVTYSENNNSVSGGTKKIMTPFALPNEVTNEISGKTFVGWTTKSDFENGDESDEETYFAKGADFTITSNAAVILYAVYATAGSGDVTISNSPLTSAPEQGAQYVIGANHKTAGIKYFSNYSGTGSDLKWGTMDASTTIYFTLSGTTSALTAYDGSAYLKNRSGGFEMSTTSTTIALQADGAIRGSSEETATRLRYNSDQDAFGLRWYAADKSTGNPAYFYKVEQNVSYSDYVISGSVALPVLDAPTGLTAGTYYEAQTITLAATNDADIYYTTDGTAPSTSSTKYTAPFTLSEYGTYNVKAIAVKEGFENSAVAEATYAIGKTFASVSDLYSYLEAESLTSMNNVKVTGLVSRITTVWDGTKGYLTYYISDNGVAENDLQMYHGAGEGASALAVGDQVMVTGNYTLFQSTTHEFGAGNTIVARTAAAVTSVAIGGAAEKTTYSPEDNVFSRAGLTATAAYNTGYTKDVTADATWTNNLTNDIVTETGKVTVTATYGDKNDTKEVDVTYTSKTLDHITLSYASITVYEGMALPTPTVTASYVEDIAAENVTELVAAANGFDTESAYDGSVAGTYTINVSYTLGTVTKNAEYTVTVKSVYNSENEPYSVAQALEIIGALFNTTTASADSIVVTGKVSRLDDTYVNTYWISDDGNTNNELEVYSGKYLNKANFTAQNQLHVGDEVVVKGKVKTYNNTREFDSNSRLVSLAREAEVTVANVAELEVGQADLAVEDLTITTLSEGAVTLVSGDEKIATIVDNKIHAVAAGEVTITANVAANGIYKAASADFTVNVVATKDRYEVTFSTGDAGENVSGNAPEAIDDQLENAEVTLPACTWTWEGHKFTGWVVTYGENVPVEVEDNQFNMPAANVTLTAQWAEVATAKISFMVGGEEKASIYKEQDVAFTIAQDGSAWAPTGFTFVGWATTEQAEETEVAPATITEYTPQAGIAEVSLYGIYSRLDNSGANYGKYEKATVVVDGDYLIVSEDYNKVFDGSLTTLDATGNYKSITITDGVVSIDNADNYAFTLATVEGGYSIKSKSGYYIGCTGAKNALDASTSQAYTNTVLIDEITSSGGPKLQYFKTSGQERFRYYASSQESIALYKKNLGTTYYTSSPAEKVTITFDANGGEGGCQNAIINKGSQLTICAEKPTKTHSEFAGWKNGSNVYEAGQAYTFDEDITLTAQWTNASTYAVTYNVNGSEAAAPTEVAQYAGDQFTVAAAIAREDYTFQGWKYGSKLYKAGAQFTMPAEAVEFVAQWRKASVPVDKMSMVTSASALSNGMQIALGCSYGENSFAMAGDIASGKSFLSSATENVSLSDGVATYTEDVVVMTLEQVEGGWKIAKSSEKYLTSSGADIKWDTQANATTWTISFNGNNVVIANGNNQMQFNSSSPRFKTYTSNQTAIQLFGKAVVVTENVSISDLGYTEGEAIIASGANVTLTIDEPTTAPSITAQNGATVIVEETTTATSIKVDDQSKIEVTAPTTVNETFSVAATMGAGKSGQISGVAKVALAQNVEAYFDITLGANGTSAQWHAIAVPFPVDAINGVYDAETGAKLTNEVNYAIMDYHGDIRAQGKYGWKKYRGIMQPGVFYLMTVDGNTKTFRFKMSGITLPTATSLELSLYAVSGDGQGTDAGWNGVANPTLQHGTVNQTVTVLNPNTYTYEDHDAGSYNFVVGTPFFIQANAAIVEEGMSMGAVDGEKPYYAPRRASNNIVENIKVFFGNDEYKDKLTISANEEALNEYEIGKDLVKMTMTNTPKVAQIFGNAYNAKMSRIYAPMSNNQAVYDLTLYTPSAGEYTIAAPEVNGYNVYLTQNGSIIWNLSMGEYTADFAKGNNEGYGIRIVKAPNATTGIGNAEAGEAGVQKVVIDNNVYILRGEKMYDATGRMVK